ncbi:MAG: membrane protein insertase YidC [Wujia sp.]
MKRYLKSKSNKKQMNVFLPGIFLSLVASFMICAFAPMELYSTNVNEFTFDSRLLIPVVIKMFAIGFLASALVMTILYMINETLYNVVLVVYFIAFVVTYVQGTYMAGSIPVLDGTPVDWSIYRKQNIATLILLIVVLMICFSIIKLAKMQGMYKVTKVFSLFIMIILSFTMLYEFFDNHADMNKENDRYVSANNMFEMSKNQNFVILLLDCVDARVMTQLMEENPEYKEIFEDFTYYRNTMCTYPYTTQSIPFILTGQWYENEQSYEDYCREAYANSPLLVELEKRDYKIGLYEKDLPGIGDYDRYDNIIYADEAKVNFKDFSYLELKAMGFKYFPYFVKEHFGYDNTDFNNLRYNDDIEIFSDVDDQFYRFMKNSTVTLTEQKTFKFIHIEGGHSPFRYNENVERIENATYETNVQACMTITRDYLQMLKDSGVYDNSVILVMADHGYEGGKNNGIDRQNPILFIKGIDEKHELQINEAPISYDDLQDAYIKLLDGATGDEVFPYKEGDERERRYIVYALRDKEHMYEYVQTGYATDLDTLVQTGETYIYNEKKENIGRLIAGPFKKLIKWIYSWTGSMAAAIIIFTFFTKLILLPLSIWVQFNSIKMVKMQPDINMINAKYYGDKETISEKQAELFKKEKYNPLITVIPMVIQLLLLMVVIDAIKGAMLDGININNVIFSFDLRSVTAIQGGKYVMIPLLAAFSAWVMCFTQNRSNVIQSEQGKLGKYGAMILSVGLSLYLGWFVAAGVALYWVASNLMSVAQMYILNFFINPKKYVDYERLEESKRCLSELNDAVSESKHGVVDKYAKREKEDYRRFFSIDNKHLVFYSENTGFYKYYKGIIEYLMEHTNLDIHYITSDPEDAIFELAKSKEQIKPYYIAEKKLITLFMKMEADVVVMTMPDLENFHIKRSYVRDDIEYIFIPHSMDSLNMTMRTGCMDHYDTVLCVGPHQKEEIQKNEIAYDTKRKKLIDWGYSLIDEMIADYEAAPKTQNEQKTIMIAPSWQEDNIVDSCLEEILDELKKDKFKVIVRPHPQHVRHRKEKMEQLKKKFADNDNIEIQTDFSSNSDVFTADLLITDWSGISYEYAYATKKPVLHINTPMKIMNPEYQTIDTVPINILVREEIGCSVDTDKLGELREKVNDLIDRSEEYHDKIEEFLHKYTYNVGTSAEVGAKYIFSAIMEQVEKRTSSKKA